MRLPFCALSRAGRDVFGAFHLEITWADRSPPKELWLISTGPSESSSLGWVSRNNAFFSGIAT